MGERQKMKILKYILINILPRLILFFAWIITIFFALSAVFKTLETIFTFLEETNAFVSLTIIVPIIILIITYSHNIKCFLDKILTLENKETFFH